MDLINPKQYGEFPVITEEYIANQILDKILENEYAVIGMDTEAAVEMSRFGILCLIQISYNDKVYIFDLLKMNIKNLKLKELFSSEKIIKIFHDCLEDLSLLCSVGEFKTFNSIFDTQIAHRMCYNDEHNCNSIGTKNIAISLKELLNYYCNHTSELKDEIHDLMSKEPYLWKTRPLTEKLIYYAGCDVKYLPKVYDIICVKCEKKVYKNVTIEKILEECKKYLKYLDINKNIIISNRMNLAKRTKLMGLIKNFQHKCVFVQLNIGYIGIVSNFNTVSLLKQEYKLGDIIEFQIVEIENDKKRLILDIDNYDEKMEEEEKNKSYENSKKVIHEGLNINKKSFFPKSYLNKYHNNTSNIKDNSSNCNYNYNYNYNNNNSNYNDIYYNMNNINNMNQQMNGFYNNNLSNNNNINNGWLYNGEDNAYYFENQDENNSSNFYYVINRFQENNQPRYGRPYK